MYSNIQWTKYRQDLSGSTMAYMGHLLEILDKDISHPHFMENMFLSQAFQTRTLCTHTFGPGLVAHSYFGPERFGSGIFGLGSFTPSFFEHVCFAPGHFDPGRFASHPDVSVQDDSPKDFSDQDVTLPPRNFGPGCFTLSLFSDFTVYLLNYLKERYTLNKYR